MTEQKPCEYHQREISMYGRYIQCQILNWQEGPPPKYLACHPLDANYREEFFATQKMGTWMRVEPREILALLDLRSPKYQDWSFKEMKLDQEALEAARDVHNRQQLTADGKVDDIIHSYLAKVASKSFADSGQIVSKGNAVYIDLHDYIEITADWLDCKLRSKFNLPFKAMTYIGQVQGERPARYKVEVHNSPQEEVIAYIEDLKRNNWP